MGYGEAKRLTIEKSRKLWLWPEMVARNWLRGKKEKQG